MATTYSDYIDYDRPVRGTVYGHIMTALFTALLTAVVVIAFVVFESRPPERVAAAYSDEGATYIVDAAEPSPIEATLVSE